VSITTETLASSASQVQSTSQLVNDFNCLLTILPGDINFAGMTNSLTQSINDFNDLMASIENSGSPSNAAATTLMDEMVLAYCKKILPSSVAFWNGVRSSKIFTSIETQNVDAPNVCPADDTLTTFHITGNLDFFPDDE
jgi:hypothetical protein